MKLSHSVAVYIPGESKGKKIAPALRRNVVNSVAERLTSLYGGATLTDGIGYSQHEDDPNFIVRESVTIIQSYTKTRQENEPLEIAKWLKSILNQRSAAYTVDGTLYII